MTARTRSDIDSLLDRPDGVRAVFQPVIDLRTGVPSGYEALSRFDLDDPTLLVGTNPFVNGVFIFSTNGKSWSIEQDVDLTFRLIGAQFTPNTRNFLQFLPMAFGSIGASTWLISPQSISVAIRVSRSGPRPPRRAISPSRSPS